MSLFLFLIYMNTIHHYIHPNIKIACYAEDIAVWHSHRDIRVSENALNKTLEGIATWVDNLKLSTMQVRLIIGFFTTDRRQRGTFRLNIKIKDQQIEMVDSPTYLGIVLDSELCFTKHIEHYLQ